VSSLLVYISVQSGRITRGSLEVLTRCREIASTHGHALHALVAHPDAGALDGAMDGALTDEVARYGPDRIYTIGNASLSEHGNAELIASLSSCIRHSEPFLVVLASTEATKDILGALAIETGAAVIPDAAGFSVDGTTVSADRPVLAAKYLVELKSNVELTLVSVRSGAYQPVESPVDAEVVPLEVQLESSMPAASLREIIGASSSGIDLSEADTVVAAGRGVKDEQGKALVLELADSLGAAIGASRAVVENGLFPATAQIGQTGKVVSPDLYIAVGISGAIQHVAGMLNSRTIIAVNKDPEAPIFQYATYGLVGDLYKLLPALTSAIKEAGAQH